MWQAVRIESDLDREKMVGILARNGYEVRIAKRKVGSRTERYIEYRERGED